MIGYFVINAAVFRIALPFLLIVSTIFRPCVLSGIYLLFLLYLPMVPIPSAPTRPGHTHTGIFLKILVVVSVLIAITQAAFQIVLFSMPPYGSFLENCEPLERILRHVGYVRLNSMSITSAITWITPEVVMTIGSIVIYMVCSKISTEEQTAEDGTISMVNSKPSKRANNVLISIGKYLTLTSICIAAILRPSVQGGLYFLVFLSSATWWSIYKELRRGFAIVLRCLMVVVFCNIVALFVIQMQWPQELMKDHTNYLRYFGLTELMTVSCYDPREFLWTNSEWASYLNPLMLIWLYYMLAIESKQLIKTKVLSEHGSTSEATPLISGVSPSKKYGSGRKTSTILQDSTGSVTVVEEIQDDIPLQSLGKGTPEEEEEKPTWIDNIFYVLESLVQIIIKSSYIATNIIMMTWSITFHSWLTFVLLLWANILWMVPNQRRAMFRCSPFLVIYAWFLLISAYVYSMNLTDEELPRTIDGVDLMFIGFQKNLDLPCKALAAKCLFMSMFWITLRQYMQERAESRQTSALADMVAPLQVTVGTAAGVPDESEKGSKIMQKIGEYVKNFLTKFWIWIVAITLFSVAITGERMTCFRIIYMALFLFFIISFQFSFKFWRKMMLVFWFTVILYSMVVLILTYTYQFENIREYWTNDMHVSKELQLDIGLEDFGTKQLFIRLVTPTFFVIITAIQIHYFHKDFMKISDPKSLTITEPFSEGSSAQGGIIEPTSEKTDLESSLKYDLTDIGNISTAQLQETFNEILKLLQHAANLFFIFMEIHLPKLVLCLAMLLCVYDKCAIYLVMIILLVLSFLFGRPVYMFSIYSCSLLVALMVLARMIYQIEYFTHENWNVTCSNIEANLTSNDTIQNNAEWLGFQKSNKEETVPILLQWNIYFLLGVTLWTVVLVRQFNYRVARGRPTNRAYFMFPKIKRSDADKNVKNCLKYLLNYGYYKFGVEISLIATATLIAIRMDMYAVFYSFWLFVLFCCNRNYLSKLWPIYFLFIAIMLPVQYAMLIGLPPSLCIEFPWDSSVILRRLRNWAYLINVNYTLPNEKLLCDFVVLLFVSRQMLVFRIENHNENREYPGGSNKSIIHHAEEKDFVNPVPDFITYCRSYLDVFKRSIFLSCMWISLAAVFLAGTNRVNIFSVGYLVGSFVFLWQGSEFYLRPIPKILRSWDWLLGYNVAVIIIKTILQLAGCVYIDVLKQHACWLVHLLAIGCINQNVSDTDKCSVSLEYIGLVWDIICFGFLLMQRRIFNSYNFFHMVNETKATTILASRGADLIEELTQKRLKEQEDGERLVLEKIKAKMDRIKASQQKIHGPNYTDTTNHFIDGIYSSSSRPKYRKHTPKTYKEAIRSGDYYMFDELDDDDDLELIEEAQSPGQDLEEDEEPPRERRLTLGEVGTRPYSVVIIDPKDQIQAVDEIDRDPQPGTSKDDDISELSEPKEDTWYQKIMNYLIFAWVFLESVMVSCIIFLNKYSREYRYILRVLNKEKKLLKEKTDYNIGLRLGTGQVWQPAGSYHTLLKDASRQASPTMFFEDYDAEMSSVDQPTIIRLILAMWYIVLSHSEILCYFVIFLDQIKSATFLSLPLPLMVFLWGTLSIPRPTKTFWVTIIAYTEIIVLIKCMFQFENLLWNRSQIISPFYPPRIIGIEKKKFYALWDLLVLLIVFFHRFLLKCLGLWKSTYIPAVMLTDGEYKIKGGLLMSQQDSSIVATASTTGAINTFDSAIAEQRVVPDSEASAVADLPKDAEDSLNSDEKIISIHTEKVHPLTNFKAAFTLAVTRYGSSVKTFFQQLLDPTSRIAADVYSYMFLCDFFNFFVLLIGYSSFGGAQQGDEGVQTYLEDNRVPVLFLLMLILQFALIIIDRAIFLRKYIFGKIVFQFSQIIMLHVWLFILYPIITDRGFNSVIPPQMYYMVKCFYLLLSAYQIRCGYPTRILGNFICKGYNYLNMFLFKAFMAIPFLFELRTVMDWMWTDTSMTVFDWIKMEDIFAHIFQLKCTRHVESEFPQARGARKNPLVKYLMGGVALIIMIAIIWFPLVFFSLGNAVGTANVPYDVTIDVRIGPYEPIYRMSVQSNSIFSFNETDMNKLLRAYDDNKAALTFINNYEANDIAAVKFSNDSATVWTISPPDRQRMIEEINSTQSLNIHLQYIVSHKSNTKEDSGIIREEVELVLPPLVNGEPNPIRIQLFEMMNNSATTPPVPLTHLFPKFIKVTNKGLARAVSSLMTKETDVKDKKFRNIKINRQLMAATGEQSIEEWWEIHEDCEDANYEDYLQYIPHFDHCKSLIMYTFNDKIFPSQLNFIAAGGIIGVYTTIVLVAGRLLRGVFAGMCFQIMFEDMPNVDRVLQLCYDVYLVREVSEFCLEEDLFAKLVFLFRSPETLIKWTRPKDETNDDDDDDEDIEEDDDHSRPNQ